MALSRVLVVESRTLLAGAMAEYLRRQGAETEARTTFSTQLIASCLLHRWDVVVADEASARRLVGQIGTTPLVIIVEHRDVARIADLVAAGAAGVCVTDEGVEAVTEAVTAVTTGGMRLPAELIGPVLEELMRWRARASAARQALGQLTPRELEVLEMLARGLGRAHMAEQLSLSPHTVRTHVHHLLRKLSLHSQLEAAAVGRRLLEEAASGWSPLTDLHSPALTREQP